MGINREHPLVQRIDRFLYSPAYFLLIGGLTILANVFCLEKYAYTGFILIGIYICLFGRDLLPIFPIFACGYISPSAGNNPGVNDNSIFSLSGGFLYLVVLLAVLAGSLVYRLVTDPTFGGKKFLNKKRQLLPGMLVLGICYAISGLASGQWETYGARNLLFAFLQLVAIAGLYYLLSGAVRWELAPKNYLFWTGICVGYVLVAELINIYATPGVVVDGVVLRHLIVTGWGHYNSMGVLFAMVIPLPFFLTEKGRFTPFVYLTALLFCGALMFTLSRMSIVVGLVLYVISYIYSLVRSRHARRIVWVHVLTVLIPVVVIAVFYEQLRHMFYVLVQMGLESPDRVITYTEGVKQFLRFPVFGGSFFPVDYWPYAWATSEDFLSLFPPRWHNTFLQLLATGGVTCLAGYILHRVQTVRLFVKNINTGKVLVGLSLLALLATSMLDCHFFNVGPVLFYSAALAIVEFQFNEKPPV